MAVGFALVGCSLPPPHPAGASADAAATGGTGGSKADAAGHEAHPCYTVKAYLDNDGDGHGIAEGAVSVAVCGDRGAPPSGYTWNPVGRWDPADCDDTNPNVYQLLYPDEDGDGVGVSTATICGGEVGNGYASTRCGEDCDDHDPTRHPSAVERFADGFDADCDGQDDPHCTDAYRPDQPALPMMSTSRERCAGAPDLAVARLLECIAGCTAQTHVAVANLGDTSYQGSVTLQVFTLVDDGEASASRIEREDLRQVLALSLAPGAVSPPILVGFIGGGDTLLSISPALADCDPSNDEVKFSAMQVECLF